MLQNSRNPEYEQKQELIIKNHLEESAKLLHRTGYTNIELLGSYASFATGLQYHKSGVKPESHQTYMCWPERNNQFDPNAMGVYNGSERIAYVPKTISAFVTKTFGDSDSSFTVVCYVSGRPTEKSCQCIYNVFLVFDPIRANVKKDHSMEIDQPSSQHFQQPTRI